MTVFKMTDELKYLIQFPNNIKIIELIFRMLEHFKCQQNLRNIAKYHIGDTYYNYNTYVVFLIVIPGL